jgi:TolB-like protein
MAFAAAVALPRIASAQAAAQDTRPGVAVLPFTNGGSIGATKENLDALQVGLSQTMITELSVNPGIRLVDRQQIAKLISEQDLGAGGRVDANTAAKIGKLVGARYMIDCGFIDISSEFRLDCHMINVETSEIFNTQKASDKRDKMFSLITEIAGKLSGGAHLPALPRQAMEQHQQQQQTRGAPSAEALTFYSRALVYADRGDKPHATEYFNRAIAAFPNYTEAKEARDALARS